ncbi:hypothetical protein ACIBG0_41355 [Nocardia sp. NPDC050630]|uniref:hypothetical protein n=1 Tax=Nocardia sp. NPDC050630 TaxID=3364321 RepID=UPI003799DD13
MDRFDRDADYVDYGGNDRGVLRAWFIVRGLHAKATTQMVTTWRWPCWGRYFWPNRWRMCCPIAAPRRLSTRVINRGGALNDVYGALVGAGFEDEAMITDAMRAFNYRQNFAPSVWDGDKYIGEAAGSLAVLKLGRSPANIELFQQTAHAGEPTLRRSRAGLRTHPKGVGIPHRLTSINPRATR